MVRAETIALVSIGTTSILSTVSVDTTARVVEQGYALAEAEGASVGCTLGCGPQGPNHVLTGYTTEVTDVTVTH